MKEFSIDETRDVAKTLNINFESAAFDLEEFQNGLNVELEHGTIDSETNITNDDPILTGKIVLAHLNEIPDYYFRLSEMEAEAEKFWEQQETGQFEE
jgi:hypothetical protein